MKLSDFCEPRMKRMTENLTLPDWRDPEGPSKGIEVWYEESIQKVYQLNRVTNQYRESDAMKVSPYGEWKWLTD
jgi:hypothetical protein